MFAIAENMTLWRIGQGTVSKIVDRTLDFFEMFAEQKRPLALSEMASNPGHPDIQLPRRRPGPDSPRLCV